MDEQKIEKLIEIIKSNNSIMRVFDALDNIDIPKYYIGAGAIVQSVWNDIIGKSQNYGISDIDIVYYDSNNLDADEEIRIKKEIEKELEEFPLWLDVKNEARVHLWYKEKFGYEIEAYESLEDAINTWPTTSTSLGIRRENYNEWVVYAPFGVEDIFDLKINANCRQITEDIFKSKVEKWMNKWSELKPTEWTGKIIPIINPEVIRIKI